MIKRLFYIDIFILIILGFFLIFHFYDKSLFLISGFERQKIEENDRYLLNSDLSFLFKTKLSRVVMGKRIYYMNKFLDKMAYPLDFKVYFNFQKLFFYLLFPIFLIGVIYLINYLSFQLVLYLILSMIFSIFIMSDKTIFLYLPLFFMSILAGVYNFRYFVGRFIRK
jgi:hypothetical protein